MKQADLTAALVALDRIESHKRLRAVDRLALAAVTPTLTAMTKKGTDALLIPDGTKKGHGHSGPVTPPPPAPAPAPAPPPPIDTTPASVALTEPLLSMNPGDTHQVFAVVKNAAGTVLATAVTFASSAPSVAAVDSATGVITAGSVAGQANITALVASPSLTSAPCVVTNVGPPPPTPVPTPPPPPDPTIPASVQVSLPTGVLTVGDMEQLAATVFNAAGAVLTGLTILWSSSNTSVVTVDTNGLVRAIAPGSGVLITATVSGTSIFGTVSLSSNAPVVVVPPDTTVASVSISPPTVSFQSGTTPLTAILKNAAGAVLDAVPTSWTSSSPSVATVNSTTGLVTFVGVGTTNVQAHYNAIASNICVVTGVASDPTGVQYVNSDFEDNTFGHLYNPWATVGGIIDIVDGTVVGRPGTKVARAHYANNPAGGNYDSNVGLYPVADLSATFGETRCFKGDVFIPHPPAGTELQNRKLVVVYGVNSGTSDGAFAIAWGQDGSTAHSQLVFAFGSGGAKPPVYSAYGLATFTWDAWHTIELEYVMESARGATDGIARVWFDGVLVFEATNLSWISPDNSRIGGFGTGYQYNSTVATDEYRYWDNIKIGNSRAAVV